MKLSLITAGLVLATSALTFTLARSLPAASPSQPVSAVVASIATPAAAATNAATAVAETGAATTSAAPALLAIPGQIGGQKLSPDAQDGVACLISKNNDRNACGDVALKREIAKCVAGIGIQGGCFDFFGKRPINAEEKIARPRRRDQARNAGYAFHRSLRNSHELRMLAQSWF